MEWIPSAISALALILVAVIESRANRERKQANQDRERSERRAKTRATESQLSMELMSASCKLGVVTAKALTNQHVNGDVEEAMKAAWDAQRNYEAFLRSQAAVQVTKT